MVRTTRRDDPDTSKRLSERPKGDTPDAQPKLQFFNYSIFQTMSQKFIKSQNKNSHNLAYRKYFKKAVYDNSFIETHYNAINADTPSGSGTGTVPPSCEAYNCCCIETILHSAFSKLLLKKSGAKTNVFLSHCSCRRSYT